MTDAAAWALVHFLWQGAALALLSWVLMRFAPGPSARYVIGVTTMAAMVVVLGATFVSMIPDGPIEHVSPAPLASATPALDQGSDTRIVVAPLPESAPAARPFVLPTTWVLSVWATGVCFLSLRVLGGWVVARRVARSARSPRAADLEHLASGVRARLGIRRLVRVVESSRVAVPVMIGWLRPIVLIPPAALAGLSPMQLEAILAHEFAHVRRHDYLVNLLQTGVETLLFFHPAVWWLSREVRRERELCCDDLAVGVCDRLTYATALSALAHLRPPSLALAATDGSLRDRIRRIVATSPSSESAKGGWMAMLPLMLVVSLAAPSAFTQTATRPVEVPVEVAASVVVSSPEPAPSVATPSPAVQVPPARPQAQPTPQPRQTTDAVKEQLLDERLAIERRKLALDKARLENDTLFELRRLELDVRNSEMNLEELKKKVATGVQNETALRNFEYSYQIQLTKLAAARRSLDIGLESITIREQELALQRRMQTAGLLPEALKLSADTLILKGNASMDFVAARELSSADVIRAGDQLTLQIAGEEQLPQEFTVDAGGSIRYPLLGTIKMAGSTVAQVQTAMAKLLTDRRLLENPQVTVTAVR